MTVREAKLGRRPKKVGARLNGFITLTMIDKNEHETRAVEIQTSTIRCFYDRKWGKAGTRLTFTDKGGFAVTESRAQVARAIAGGRRPRPSRSKAAKAARAAAE